MTPHRLTASTFSIWAVLEVGELHERLDDAGHVDQPVDATVRLAHRVGQGLDGSPVGEVGDVGAEPVGDAVVASSGCLVESFAAQVDGGDATAAGEQRQDDLAPDPVPPAGDHEDLVGDLHGCSSRVDEADRCRPRAQAIAALCRRETRFVVHATPLATGRPRRTGADRRGPGQAATGGLARPAPRTSARRS